ncbi:MAG TPA: histidine phosphatase family protein [Methanocorpusculum sp.]|nr:histidine phosphatase family protein [Methanocorpusculum sp.]
MEYPVPSPDKTHHLFGGSPIYSARFLEVRPFVFPGLAAVRDRDGWYHIDFSGNPAYKERYSYAGDFSCGAAVVSEIAGEYFYIDQIGRRIDPLSFIRADDFKDNIACVYHKEYGAAHITTSGELLYNEWFYDVRPFEGDTARIRDESGWHFIDKQGNIRGCADAPDDSIPPGTVRKTRAKNKLPEIIRAHHGYDACVILIRHAEREPFLLGEGGSDKKLTPRGEKEAKKLAALLPKISAAYASPISRCMNTAKLIAGSAVPDTALGMPGAYIYNDPLSHEFYVDNDTLSAIRSYLAGRVLPGHYPVAEGTKYFLAHLKEIAEDGKAVLCVTHDAFAVSCIGVLTGYSFVNDWIDFLDGCVLFRYGDVWKLCWREGECSV